MALRPCLWLENAGAAYHAGDYRRLLEQLFADPGVIHRNLLEDLTPSENSPAGMSVLVARGAGVVAGGEDTDQGRYLVVNDDAAAVAIAASDPTDDRIDLVGIRVRDDEYSGAAHAADLFAVTGTPSASPDRPTPPDNFLELAEVYVAAGVSSILNADITDQRTFTGAGVIGAFSPDTFPDDPPFGTRAHDILTKLNYLYRGSVVSGGSAGYYLDGEQILARTVLGSAGASMSCSLPSVSNLAQLRIVIRAQHASSTNIDLGLRFNGDTGNNYYRQNHSGSNTTAAASPAAAQSHAVIGTVGNQSANRWTAAEAIVVDPRGSGHKSGLFRSFDPRDISTGMVAVAGGLLWASTAAISSVLARSASGNLAAGSSITVYGSSE